MQTEAPSAAPARTEEMAVIHRIFRRGFPMIAELVQDWSTPQGQELVKLLVASAPMQPID